MTAATFLWAWPMIFIHYIKRETDGGFNADALNVYRYASGAIFVLFLAAARRPADLAAVLRRWPAPLALAALLAAFQIVWVQGVWRLEPAYGTLVSRASVVFALLFGFLLFADERRVIRSGRFLLSGAVALAAVAGIILLDPRFALAGAEFRTGTALMLASAVLWGLYAAAIRRLAGRLPSLAAFAVTAAMTTLLLLLWALCRGRPLGAMWTSPWNVQLAVLFSGAMCVGATQALYFKSLRRIGVAYSSLVSLATPFLTGVFAFLALGEALTGAQWLCGAALAAGLGAMIHGSARRPGPTDEEVELEG